MSAANGSIVIACPRCDRALPGWLFRDSHIESICTQCQSALDVYSFPALYRKSEKLDAAQLSLTEGEACCYQHASKRAAGLCAHCGRFLCGLCEVPVGNEILCPECMHGQQSKPALETQRTKYDSIALAWATWPVLTIYFTILTAPLAFGMAVYAWNRPTSIVRHSRWRLYAAVALSLLQMGGMAALIVFFIYAYKQHL